MNKYQRKDIREIINKLNEIKDDLSMIISEEREKIDNIPENLQMSERAEKMQDSCRFLEDAESSLEEEISYLEDSISL